MLTTANTGKIGRGFGKNAGEWTGRVEINEEEIPGSKRSMYGYILTTPGFTGRTFKLCVLTRWDFNFCIRSSPLRGRGRERDWKEEVSEGRVDWLILSILLQYLTIGMCSCARIPVEI